MCVQTGSSLIVYFLDFLGDNVLFSNQMGSSDRLRFFEKAVRDGFRVKLRQVEFGRAALQRLLDERKPVVWYYGMLRQEHDDVKTGLGTLLYNFWDSSSRAPPKQRAREPEEAPSLQALGWHNGEAKFPDALVNRFPADSFERERLLKLQANLEETFVSSVPSAAVVAEVGSGRSQGALVRSGSTQSVRAIGRPDWTIEDGQPPLALDQEIRLEHVPAASFGVSRPAAVIFCSQVDCDR